MKLLEYYQNLSQNSEKFISRKSTIPHNGDINLYGVRGAGKTSLIIDYISELDNTEMLYIDCEDPNLILNILDSITLQKYIDKNNIHYLILDHYYDNFLHTFPNVDRLIIVTRIPLNNTGFIPLELFPLDYEEFLAFENTSIQGRGFNNFLRLGTLPLLARSQKETTQAMKSFFQSTFSQSEQKLLLILAQHHTKHLTTHQIYTFSKEKFKVSKDWLYKTVKLFIEEKLIIFIEDKHEKSGKKMFLFDFAFAKYLTLGQPFILQFDTMVTLALMKHHINVQTLGIHGYITNTNELIIPAPFESEESLWTKSYKKFALYKKHHIQKITIVTVANTYTFTIENILFEALPFNEWSVINDEHE